jgi:hypothetical protein
MTEMTQEERRLLNVACVKVDNGERLTAEERRAVLMDEGREFVDEVKRILRENENDTHNGRLMIVVANLFGRVMKISNINVEKREALEDRIAALERAEGLDEVQRRVTALEVAAKLHRRAAAKLRQPVKAPTRRT